MEGFFFDFELGKITSTAREADEITESEKKNKVFRYFYFFSFRERRKERKTSFFREKTTNFTLTYPQIKSKHRKIFTCGDFSPSEGEKRERNLSPFSREKS
jgi:hypothetical protein